MRQFQNIQILALLLLMALTQACSPGFKTTSPELKNLENVAALSYSCSLKAQEEVAFGQTQQWQISYDFVVPAEAKLIWKGQRQDHRFEEEFNADDRTLLKDRYLDPSLAGIESRALTVLNANDEHICTTNAVETLKLMATDADQNCVKLEGRLEQLDEVYSICSIRSMTLFRAMSDRDLIPADPGSGSGSIGMANPASVNCARIGGFEGSSAAGSDGVCRIDKQDLLQAIRVL